MDTYIMQTWTEQGQWTTTGTTSHYPTTVKFYDDDPFNRRVLEPEADEPIVLQPED